MLRSLFKPKIKFLQIPQIDECESSTSKSEGHWEPPSTSARWDRTIWLLAGFISALLLIVGLAIMLVCMVWLGFWTISPDMLCTEHISQYSPVMKDVDISYELVGFNGSLMIENVFRQGAGPDVDAAWESLGVDYRVAIVPPELAAKSGLSPDQVQVSDQYGGGFPANVEGLHHLHCLNLLRQSLYFNFDYYHDLGMGAFKNSDDILRLHVTHCLDILRQQLMCTVDIAVLGQVWWDKEEPKAFPDFNTVHKCRNFEAVRQWAEVRQAPENVPEDYLKPPRNLETVYETMP